MPAKNPFSSKKRQRRKSAKIVKAFDQEQRKQLADSDKGSYYNQNCSQESLGASAKKIKLDCETGQSSTSAYEECQYVLPTRLTIVDPSFVNDSLQEAASCKLCHETIQIFENVNHRKGFGTVWAFRCANEDCGRFHYPTESHTSSKSGYIYDINRSATVGMRAIGRGCSAAEKLFSIMNIAQPTTQKPWANHTEALNKATIDVLDKELKSAAWESKVTQRSLNKIPPCSDQELSEKIVDVGVSLDCSWSSRGWSATDGVVAAVDVNTGKVLDVVHLNSSCPTCKKLEQNKVNGSMSRADFLKAILDHEEKCLLNHEGSASSMEAAGVLTLYKRSIAKNGLRYIPYIGDGDSSGYSAVEIEKPYGPSVFIPKEECISHITKRMGSNLRNLVKEYKGKKLKDGKQLTGQGRLTRPRINAIQNFYGRSIRQNKGDAKAMAQATQAILKHYASTVEDPKHDDCPKGSKSWCSYQREIATKIKQYKPVKNPFSEAIVEVLQPLFNRLGSETLLAGCEKCYTQNTNESLHHVVWGMAPKEQYNSAIEIDTAINLGVLQYNRGFANTYAEVLPKVDVPVSEDMHRTWADIDRERVYQSNYKATRIVQLKRKKKRAKKLAAQDAFVHQEGIQYKSQSFYEKGNASSRGKKAGIGKSSRGGKKDSVRGKKSTQGKKAA